MTNSNCLGSNEQAHRAGLLFALSMQQAHRQDRVHILRDWDCKANVLSGAASSRGEWIAGGALVQAGCWEQPDCSSTRLAQDTDCSQAVAAFMGAPLEGRWLLRQNETSLKREQLLSSMTTCSSQGRIDQMHSRPILFEQPTCTRGAGRQTLDC